MFPQHTKISGWLSVSRADDTPRSQFGYLYCVPAYYAIDMKISG
jgi:hypothetical protein